MLMTIGRGLAPAARPTLFPFKSFNFTQSLPTLATFERASAATTTNASGKLIEVAANEPRFDHTENGTPLGIYIEPSAENKCDGYNINPTDTTGFTTNSQGILSVVDDSTELAAAGLDDVCTNGKVYKAQATGASTFAVYIPGTCGNVNAHSMQFYARGTGAGDRTARLSLGGATMDIAKAGDGYGLYQYQNVIPNSSGRKFTISIDGNDTLYFILYQLEENTECSSIIPVKGVSVTRPTDKLYISSIDQQKWFDPAQGYMVCRYIQGKLLSADSYAAVLNDGSSSNAIGLRLDQSNHTLRGYLRANGSSQFTDDNEDYQIAETLNAAGICWNSSEAVILSGGSDNQGTITQIPININILNIGTRNGGASSMHGHIQAVEVGTRDLTLQQLGQRLQKPNDNIIIGAGQSLIRGYFNSAESGSEAGKQKIRELMGQELQDSSIVLVDGSTGTSAACKSSNATNYWWDSALNVRGPAFDTFYSAINNAAVKPTSILWGQGEEDSHNIGISTTIAAYKSALENIFSDMRASLGNIDIYIQRIGRRTVFSNTGGVQAVRNIQQELIDENPWCHEATEIYDLDLFDQVHLDDAAYLIAAERNSLVFLGENGAVGPQITNAARSGTTITVTINHDAGADFTPTANIEGFKFFDDAAEISITNAIKTDSVTITLTLASTPTGIETLYYGYDDMNGLNTSNVIKDDAEPSMPLRTDKISL